MDGEKSIYELLNELETGQQAILEEIKKKNAEGGATVATVKAAPQRSDREILFNFIKNSVQKFLWLGTATDFNKERKTAVWLLVATIIMIVLTTVVASIAFKLYSTFTLFENIWLIFVIILLKDAVKAKTPYNAVQYSQNCAYKFEMGEDGVLYCLSLKKRYKVFISLSCICSFFNVFYAWIGEGVTMPVLVTVLEVGVVALVLASYFVTLNFFAGYIPMSFTGRNGRGEIVTLYYNSLENKLYSEEDFKKQFPFIAY